MPLDLGPISSGAVAFAQMRPRQTAVRRLFHRASLSAGHRLSALDYFRIIQHHRMIRSELLSQRTIADEFRDSMNGSPHPSHCTMAGAPRTMRSPTGSARLPTNKRYSRCSVAVLATRARNATPLPPSARQRSSAAPRTRPPSSLRARAPACRPSLPAAAPSPFRARSLDNGAAARDCRPTSVLRQVRWRGRACVARSDVPP